MKTALRLLILLVVFAAVAWPLAAQEADPASFPARDEHQGVLIAADPYTDAARAKAKFGKKNPFTEGFLAVEVFVRNDNDFAVEIDLAAIELMIRTPGGSRQRIQVQTLDEMLDRMLSKGGTNPTRPRTPLPIPRSTPNKSKEWQKLETEWRPLIFEMNIMPPRSTARGFIFFNLGRRFELVPHSSLYIPDLYFLPERKALLFFEMSLAPTSR